MSARPRLGFVGLGWIGGARLDAVARAGVAQVAALADPDRARLATAAHTCAGATTFSDGDALLEAAPALELDGVVLATPNGCHAGQALAALDRGLAVFVQKPLATRAADVERVLAHARSADRALAVDYSYRGLSGARDLRSRIAGGELGEVFLIDGVFHNAYGPDRSWCYDPELGGGGCLLDLGVHLADLALFIAGGGTIRDVGGWIRSLADHPAIDGFASVAFHVEGGPRVRFDTSWHAHTGRDCEFRLTVSGTNGAAEIRNVDGSFYDFELCMRDGRRETIVAREGRAWMDRVVVEWAARLAQGARYDSAVETSLDVARVVDTVYGRSPEPSDGAETRPRVAARSSSPLVQAPSRGSHR